MPKALALKVDLVTMLQLAPALQSGTGGWAIRAYTHSSYVEAYNYTQLAKQRASAMAVAQQRVGPRLIRSIFAVSNGG